MGLHRNGRESFSLGTHSKHSRSISESWTSQTRRSISRENQLYQSWDAYELDDDDDDDSSDYGTGTNRPSAPSSSYPRTSSRPLIDFVKNEWRTNSKYNRLSNSPSPHGQHPQFVDFLLSIVTAPRFRRYIVVYISLLLVCFVGWKGFMGPRLKEHGELLRSLDINSKDRVGGWFGSNALPMFSEMVQLRKLDASFLPGPEATTADDPNRKRLIVIGDVHGCRDELDQLLSSIDYNRQKGDHLVFTGDLINKGPDSIAVVDLAREQYASCVRGNHEDRILLMRREIQEEHIMRPETITDTEDEEGEPVDVTKHQERMLAKTLNDDQAQWLANCPVILKLGQIKGMGEVVVVHGGLVPGVELHKQDPTGVMTMRTVDLDTHVPSSSKDGMAWTKLYNKHQSMLYKQLKKTGESGKSPESQMTTVIYGHDSQSSVALGKYTKGLDTGCVKGGKLSALIIEDGGKTSIKQVKCKDRVKAKTT